MARGRDEGLRFLCPHSQNARNFEILERVAELGKIEGAPDEACFLKKHTRKPRRFLKLLLTICRARAYGS
jgi:hypothetical protein